MVDIKGLDKARVLKALYDNSHVQGLGIMQASGPITVEHCAALLEKQTYFDYLYGRVLKVELPGDEFDECLYDRDCGEGAAQRAVDSIRAGKQEGGDTDKDADGGKKELTIEEEEKMVKDALEKIMNILAELPPDAAIAASVVLKAMLPVPSMGGMAGMLMIMGRPSAPPTSSPFGMLFPFGGRFR